MPLISRLASLVRNLTQRDRVDRELDAELRATFDLLVDERIRAGADPQAARRAARIDLGTIHGVKEQVRDVRTGAFADTVLQDVRWGMRLLHRNRLFAMTAGVTLALCIAANTALFTIVHHVLLEPLAIPASDRVVLVYNSYPKPGILHARAAVPDYFDRLRDVSALETQALFDTFNPTLDVNGAPERTHAMRVTPSFFRVIQVSPRVGRAFTEEEGELSHHHVAILASSLARQQFGDGDPVGRDVRLDGELYTVVGVMPSEFAFVDSGVKLWVPAAFTEPQKQMSQRHANNWTYIGRVRSGATLEQVQAQVDALNAANFERFPMFTPLIGESFHSVVVPLHDDLIREVRRPLYLLWAGAACVLLIGCVNVASLVFARSQARVKELAMRAALGAGQWRMIRQLVTEHLVLTVLAAVAGVVMAAGGLRAFGTLDVEHLRAGTDIQLDRTVAAYTAAIAVLASVAIAAIPAFAARRMELAPAFREGRMGTSGRGARTLRRALIVVQVSVALVLLIGAGLLLASFHRVVGVDPGFNPAGVLTASMTLPTARYRDAAALRRATDDLLQAVRTQPGVIAAGTTTAIPFGNDFSTRLIFAEGSHLRPGETPIGPYRNVITPGYFEAMGVRLIHGRFFDDRDASDVPRVAIVDATLAHRFWPGTDPVGRRMFLPTNPRNPAEMTPTTPRLTVVGVVSDVKLRGLVEGVGDVGAYYFPQAQAPERTLTVAVRGAGDPSSLAPNIRTAIAGVDRELAVFDVQTMEDRADRSLGSRRSSVVLSSAFGGVALLLSALGIYAVLACLVAQRTKEIGIRMAIGGSRLSVFALIVREGALLVLCGITLGAIGTAALARTLQSQLFGIAWTDPAVLAMACVTLGSVALAACALPAFHATRINPIVALSE
jgi:putative ABC transport system permease protein